MSQTVQDLINNLQELIKLKPEAKDYPIIYSHDDEGNVFQKVHNPPALTQVEDLNEHYVETVGYYDPEDEDEAIALTDCNCVIIN